MDAKERDAQSVLIEEQRRLLAAKQTEIGALEAERDDLRKIVEMVHADLGIQPGDHIGEAISELKKEASDATARQRMTEVRALKYSAQAEDARREIERLTRSRAHAASGGGAVMSGKRDNLKVTSIVSVRMSIELTQPWDAKATIHANGEASIIMNVADAERLLKGKHEA